MAVTDIKNAIFEGLGAIAPEANLEELPPNENVRQALDIDSYDFLNFLIGLNQRLGVEIPEADYGKLTTLTEMVNYLSARTG
jgi:acyl carrier protein